MPAIGPRPIAAALLALACAACVPSKPDCTQIEVYQTIGTMFRRQLKLTPFIRFIDIDDTALDIESIFTIGATDTSASCVAFAKYEVKLNADGQRNAARKDLVYSLISELGSEKQIYYSVTRGADGHVDVRVGRVSG